MKLFPDLEYPLECLGLGFVLGVCYGVGFFLYIWLVGVLGRIWGLFCGVFFRGFVFFPKESRGIPVSGTIKM